MSQTVGVRRHAYVDLSALLANAASFGEPLSEKTADLRADAYGHGLIPLARALTEAGIGSLLVSREADAAALADEGITAPARVGTPGTTHPPDAAPLLGIELYGLSGHRSATPLLRLIGEVIAVKRVSADRGVSYGYTYRTERPSTLALVGLGYADGIFRAASNRAPVQVGEFRGRVSGRIAMDQFVVDIGDAEVRPGDPVVLFGDPARGEPSALEWADALGIAAPVITSRLGRRIQRRHRG